MTDHSAERSTILITGGAGFIGSWIAARLASNYNVIVFDKLTYCASTRNLEGIQVQFVQGDITNPADVDAVFRSAPISKVIHCAAQSHVEHSFTNAVDFTTTNVLGTQIMLEAARTHKVSLFLHFSTDEVYGETGDEGPPKKEDAALVPTTPYAASKAAADLLVQAYVKSFHFPAITVRCCNVYGPRQYPEKIVPTFIQKLSAGQPATLQGSGKHRRCYAYAGDVAAAIQLLLEQGQLGTVYNITSEFELSNMDVLTTILIALQFPACAHDKLIQRGRDRQYNDNRYLMEGSRLRALGWEPKVTFFDGIKKTIKWYHAHGQANDHWWPTQTPNTP